MKKRLLALAVSLALVLPLAACGNSGSGTDDSAGSGGAERITLKVAASPTPHAEILAQVKDTLAGQGIDLVVTEYGDYVIPNTAVEDGDEDANYFQHITYLNEFNESRGTHLVAVANLHYEPFGIYAGRTASLEELPDGATIAVPSDPTNEGRALKLLEDIGLLTLREGAGLAATTNDIVENPKNIQFKELEAAVLPSALPDVDCAVINGNYALGAGLKVSDALAVESSESDAAQAYGNVLVVREGSENSEAIQALITALRSDAVRDYINETYAGAVVPLF